MKKTTKEKTTRRDSSRFSWVVELAIFTTVIPALVYGVLALNSLPYVA